MKLRSCLAALAVTATALAGAAPASAAPTFTMTANSENLGHPTNPFDSSMSHLAVECAVHVEGAKQTRIGDCYLESQADLTRFSAGRHTTSTQGTNDAIANVLEVPSQPYRACVRAGVTWSDGKFYYETQCFVTSLVPPLPTLPPQD